MFAKVNEKITVAYFFWDMVYVEKIELSVTWVLSDVHTIRPQCENMQWEIRR